MNSLLTNAEASQREAEMAHELELRRLQLELENKTRELNAAKEQMNDVGAEFQKYKVRLGWETKGRGLVSCRWAS